ncbi:hypothetical protein PG993_009863 [Apiospora rasikravindrae]|uniref:Uncharacterized protein n=1 Tax=Apiospora rasikravindrae TaxID=990691 RepID=A0ABR1SKL6_9PEZI
MPYPSDRGYKVTSSGVNSQGNHYCHRDYGSSVPNRNNYHYSNRNRGYYYRNPDGSTYYDDGRGRNIYTAPNGQRYYSVRENQSDYTEQASPDDSPAYPYSSVSRNASPSRHSSPSDDRSDGLQVTTPSDSPNVRYFEEIEVEDDYRQAGNVDKGYDELDDRAFDNAIEYRCDDVPNDEAGGIAYDYDDGYDASGYDDGGYDAGDYDDGGSYDDGGYDDDGYYDDGGYDDGYVCDY